MKLKPTIAWSVKNKRGELVRIGEFYIMYNKRKEADEKALQLMGEKLIRVMIQEIE